jgi:CRP/FNR family transcriptional regulator, cyclic AMP receptor protein
MPHRMDSTEELIEGMPGASDALKALARRGVVKTFQRDRVLIDEGDQGDTLFIILAGRLRAFAEGDNGREVTFGSYGPGEYVGEMSLDGGLRSASVMAVEKSTCVIVTRRTLEQHLAEHPAFAFELLAKVIRRARAATVSARQMALNDVYGRLRLLLESLAEGDTSQPRPLTERLTHKEMAARIGSSREMVSRIVKELERGGYVATDPSGSLMLLRVLPMKW